MADKKRISASEQITKGFFAPFRALLFLREHRGLKKYFVIPFLINLILLSAIFYVSYTMVNPALISLIPKGDAWYLATMRWIAQPLFLLAVTLICIFMYSILGSILTAPFNDPLSARVENILSGAAYEEGFSVKAFISDIVRIAVNMIKFIIIILLINIILFILNIIPWFGSFIYSTISFLSAMFFFGFGFFDFPLDRRRLLFGQKLRITWRYKFMTIGLGMGFAIMTFVPLLGFLGLNLATIGATALFVDYMDLPQSQK